MYKHYKLCTNRTSIRHAFMAVQDHNYTARCCIIEGNTTQLKKKRKNDKRKTLIFNTT